MRKTRVLAEIKTSTEISLVIKINIRVIRFRLGQSISFWFYNDFLLTAAALTDFARVDLLAAVRSRSPPDAVRPHWPRALSFLSSKFKTKFKKGLSKQAYISYTEINLTWNF